ncbi:MAG: FAD-dependent oxidoreductase [Candidatus Zipacnadales bacterium]
MELFLLAMMGVYAMDLPPSQVPARVIWLEAEGFDETGGWVNDPQFVDVMGSPFLLANGVGKPVADAVTTAKVPEPGRYRLWVRCRDWLPEYSPGRFEVWVGGIASATIFGVAETDNWQWVDGGLFVLESGELEVRLHDLTGWWGRCDVIVLTTGEKPPNELEVLAAHRVKYGGLSPSIRSHGPYDLVVVGGGMAGCSAAIAAARHGCKVALIQDRPVLGGNNSSEIQVPLGGDQSREPLDPGETGIIEELERGPERGMEQSDLIESVVRAESKIELYLNTRAVGVRMRDRHMIASILAMNVHTGQRMEFEGALFADCTGDGWVGFWAGADFREGREARSEFGEPLALPQADKRGMSSSLHNARFETRPYPVPFEAPPWAYSWEKPEDFEQRPMSSVHISGDTLPDSFLNLTRGAGRKPTDADGGAHHVWWVELGGMQDRIYEAEYIRDELFRVHIGLWDYVKNHDPQFMEQNRNRELVWINPIVGKRESRRLMGDYLMTQRDFSEKIMHPDCVAYGGWSIDDHHPQGFWAPGAQAYHAYFHKVSIPYRSLYSRNIANLFMAGRNISVTHVALGGIRVMRTTCLMGQAVGTAAAVAREHHTLPRGVYQKYLTELQQTLLRDGCYLMGVRNEDPHDLALRATATASSVAKIEDPSAEQQLPHGGVIHDLNSSRAFMFTAKHAQLESIDLFLRSERSEPALLKLTLREAKAWGDFSSTVDLASAEATVPPKSAGWVEFPLQAELHPGRLYYAWLPAAEGLKWDLYPYIPEGTCRAYGGPNWTTMTHCYKHRLHPGGEPLPPSDWKMPGKVSLEPQNIINGWNRAVHGTPNSWGPDPAQSLPQWIELRWPKPVRLTTIYVIFQNRSMAAKQYTLSAVTEGQVRVLVEVDDNRARRCVHKFKSVETKALRFTILAPPSSGLPVQVCEIRAYGDP